jgi:phenylacetate-coenzyme A ligase PaaK-like adenylate-forming protein
MPNEHWTRRFWISLWDLVESPTLIMQVKPDVVIGSPQQLEAIVKLVYTAKRIQPPKVFVNAAERLDTATRRRIESETGANVVDVYCSSELSTLIAFQCRNYTGFHTNSDYVIVEVIDSTGNQVEPGQEGEIVVTDLCNYVAPVIRYRLGDVATVATSTCDCGRALPTLIAKINGRVVDQIKLSDGRVLNAMPLVDHLQASVGYPLTLIQNEHSNFTLKCYSTYPTQSIVKKDWIEQMMREHLGVSVEIQICIEELSQALHNSPRKIRPFLSCLPREEHVASISSNKATHLELGSHGDTRPVYHPTKEN